MDYEGELFISAEDTEGEAERRKDMARLYSAMQALSPIQRELVEKVYFEERKITDIAAEENVSHVAIIRRLNRIYEKLKKICKTDRYILPFPWPNSEGSKNERPQKEVKGR